MIVNAVSIRTRVNPRAACTWIASSRGSNEIGISGAPENRRTVERTTAASRGMPIIVAIDQRFSYARRYNLLDDIGNLESRSNRDRSLGGTRGD